MYYYQKIHYEVGGEILDAINGVLDKYEPVRKKNIDDDDKIIILDLIELMLNKSIELGSVEDHISDAVEREYIMMYQDV